jgi:hypothetical protein
VAATENVLKTRSLFREDAMEFIPYEKPDHGYWKTILRTPTIRIGLILVLFGFLMPYLMVIGVVEASLWLCFLSHAASVSGLFLGFIGAAMTAHTNRPPDEL